MYINAFQIIKKILLMKKILCIILLFPLLYGCNDFLEPQQVNTVYNEVFWETQSDAQAGVLGIYALYRGLMVNPQNWYNRADATTNFIKRGWNGGSSDALYVPGNFESPTSTVRSWGGLNGYANWGSFYKVVAMANLVIAKVEEMPDGVFVSGMKDQLLGEAYFLRGLIYFNILRLWGNAPYISESIESSTQVIDNDLTPIQIPRTDDIEIGKKVLEDVNKSVEKLKHQVAFSTGWGIRANRGSAEALAGHVNMWMHFLATRDNISVAGDYLKNAITALESLKNNGGYGLEDYSKSNILEVLYKEPSIESVFQLNISTATNESYRIDDPRSTNIQMITIKVTPHDGDVTKDMSSSVNFVPISQKNLMYPEYDFTTQSGDLRPHIFFDAWDSHYDYAFSDVSANETDRTLVTWMKKYNFVSVDASREWNEWTAYFAEADIPVFRYTDVYLLLAEAYVKDNQLGKAKVIVDEIRSRAGLTPYSGSDMLKEVLQQRIAELFGEGHLYFDMVRNNYFPNAAIMDAGRYNQKGYYWPVSSEVLSANKLVSQTPYWNGKTSW